MLKAFQQSRSYLSWAVKDELSYERQKGRHFQWQGWNLGKAEELPQMCFMLFGLLVFLLSFSYKSLPSSPTEYIHQGLLANWKWLERRRKQRITQKYLTKTTRKMELLLAEKKTRGRKSHQKKKGEGSQNCAPYTGSFCLEQDKSFSNLHKTNV